jgi:biotin carboxylase
VDAVIAPGIDWPVAVAARVARRLGLPHPLSPDAATLATSKLRQRERFAEAGVPQPRWQVCKELAEAKRAGTRFGYPCVVKAPDRQGQRGLSVAGDEGALPGAVQSALAASRSRAFLVEELIDGSEVTVNGFSLGGRFFPLTVTDRRLARPPAFGVALAHVWPSRLEPAQVGAAIEAAGRAARALAIEDGPTYTQILMSDRGPKVMELAARLGGGHDAELCTAALGVDLNELALAAALGVEIPAFALAPADAAGGACVLFLVAREGELRDVRGVEEARAVEGVRLLRVYREPGHRFGPLRRGADRAGAVLAVGDSRSEAVARAREAAGLIRFEVAPVEALV